MTSSSWPKLTTKVLWLGAVVLFVLAEVDVAIVLWKIPDDHLGTKYLALFLVALPLVAGLNGYYSVKRRLSSSVDEVASILSAQFLMTIIIAYTALLVCISSLAAALQHFLN